MPPVRPPRPHPPGAGGDSRRRLGLLGEAAAAAYLRRLGFSELERNARTRHGEIDLIAFDGRTLVFAEVKTRRVRARQRDLRPDQEPLAGLTERQRARLRRLAVGWLADETRERPSARAIRFDAIGVVIDTNEQVRRLDHIEGAF
jgi:putative endonuclease